MVPRKNDRETGNVVKTEVADLIEVPQHVWKNCTTWRNMVESMDESQYDFTQEVPVTTVGEFEIRSLIKYYSTDFSSKNEGETEENNKLAWVNKNLETHCKLFAVILAANFLHAQDMLDTLCKSVAYQIRGRTPEQIRTHFNIKNDFTPEEEEEIRAENAWAEESFK